MPDLASSPKSMLPIFKGLRVSSDSPLPTTLVTNLVIPSHNLVMQERKSRPRSGSLAFSERDQKLAHCLLVELLA